MTCAESNVRLLLRQRRPEVRAENGKVQSVDRPVAVLVEVVDVIWVAERRAKSGAEERQVKAVDRLVAVDVAVVAKEARLIVPALNAALHLVACAM